jgi:glycosyltransferase involved in cell wall biosynthesis
MKALTFTTLYPNNVWPNQGVFIKERMTHFAKLNGCKVKVIAPVPYFPPVRFGSKWLYSQVARQEVIEGLEVYHPRYFMIPKLGMSLYGLKMFLSVIPTVKKVQKDFDFDIIDAHYVYPDGFAATLLGKFFKRPVVVSARGTDINLYMTFPVIQKLVKYTLDKSNQVIAVCQALKEAIGNLGIPEDKIIVIPNGVDLSKFYPIPKNEARVKLGLPNKRIILSVGSLIPRKGFDLLIRAFRILSEKFQEKDLHLIIVGEGSSRKELEKLISSLKLIDNIRLVGDIPHQELYLWYNASDLFCLASSREGWPNVVMESLACGTPVVATSVWGIPEIIRSNEIGILADRTERDIAEKILLGLEKKWQPDTIASYVREHKHTWEKVAQSVFHVFESLLNGKDRV